MKNAFDWTRKRWSPLAMGIVTLPLWLVLLQLCAAVNNQSMANRRLLLTGLGGVVAGLLLVNILAIINAVRLFPSGTTIATTGIVLNALQVFAIIGLITLGLILTA